MLNLAFSMLVFKKVAKATKKAHNNNIIFTDVYLADKVCKAK